MEMEEKRYIQKVIRSLDLDKSLKEKIRADLETEFDAAREQGETCGQVIQRMGDPQEVAAEFNESYEGDPRKKKRNPLHGWRMGALVSGITGTAFLLLYALFGIHTFPSLLHPKSLSSAIIGGADGPTAIFVTSSPNASGLFWWRFLVGLGLAGLLVCAICLIVGLAQRRKKNRSKK